MLTHRNVSSAETDDGASAWPVDVVVQQVWYNDHRHDVCTMIYQALVTTGQGVESRALQRKEEAMADRVGQQLGNYRLLTLLGKGGFAEVYLGQHLRFNQQAAIKVLHLHLTGTEAQHF